jgi:hypothetical protein
MAWIDDALPMPPARPIEADEALDAAASALVAVTASVAAMQLFIAFVLERPAETALYVVAVVATGIAGFVPVESRRRRAALAASGWASAIVWLAMVPLVRDGMTLGTVVGLAAASAMLSRRLSASDPRDAAAAPPDDSDPTHGWIEDAGVVRLPTDAAGRGTATTGSSAGSM